MSDQLDKEETERNDQLNYVNEVIKMLKIEQEAMSEKFVEQEELGKRLADALENIKDKAKRDAQVR